MLLDTDAASVCEEAAVFRRVVSAALCVDFCCATEAGRGAG
ncbi:hypothetical protein [Geomonas sp.]|nr:hypothetical protein [Geomonas sp.]